MRTAVNLFLCLAMLSSIFACKGRGDNRIKVQDTAVAVSTVDTLSTETVIEEEPAVDTAEYIAFWKEFQKAVLEKDTKKLSAMVADSLSGDCVWTLIYGDGNTDKPYAQYKGILPKRELLRKLDSIFTPVYTELLRKYDVKKDSYSPVVDEYGTKQYVCTQRIKTKEYRVETTFCGYDWNKNGMIAIFSMGFSDDEADVSDSFSVGLYFMQTPNGIKLYQINCQG